LNAGLAPDNASIASQELSCPGAYAKIVGSSAAVLTDEIEHLILNHQTRASFPHSLGRLLEDFHCATSVTQGQPRAKTRHRSTDYYNVERFWFVHG
jgi:hypothetical protein